MKMKAVLAVSLLLFACGPAGHSSGAPAAVAGTAEAEVGSADARSDPTDPYVHACPRSLHAVREQLNEQCIHTLNREGLADEQRCVSELNEGIEEAALSAALQREHLVIDPRRPVEAVMGDLPVDDGARLIRLTRDDAGRLVVLRLVVAATTRRYLLCACERIPGEPPPPPPPTQPFYMLEEGETVHRVVDVPLERLRVETPFLTRCPPEP